MLAKVELLDQLLAGLRVLFILVGRASEEER